MGAPWEKYGAPPVAAPQAEGPWSKYAAPAQAPAQDVTQPEVAAPAARPERPHTGFAAQVGAALQDGVGPVQQRSPGQIWQAYVDIGKGAAIGVPSGIAGFPGDVESLGRNVMATAGAPVSRETMLPTSEGVGNYLGGEPASQEEAIARTIGSFAGPGLGFKAASGLAKGAARTIGGSGPTVAAKAAHDAGYALPPAMVSKKPGVVSQVLGLSGKLKLQQAASAKNQDVTNRLASQALGLPEGEAITEASLKAVRNVAYDSYKDVAKSVNQIKSDAKFIASIAGLGKRTTGAAKAFPGLVKNNDIENIVATLTGTNTFSPEAGLELVRHLRADAGANLKAFHDPGKLALGRAQREAAEAVDDLMERNLTALGKPDLVHSYRDARQQLARTYDVEAALDSSGNVSAKVLGARAKKGRPLSGGLKDIADTARNFPKATQSPSQFGGTESLSVVDLGAAGLSGGATIPLSFARPGARSILLSPTYQNMLMRQPGSAAPGFNSLANNPLANAFALPNAMGPENAFNRPVNRAK